MTLSVAKQRVLVIGTMDTKGAEIEFLAARLRDEGLTVKIIDATPARWLKDDDGIDSRDEAIATTAARIAAQLQSFVAEGAVGGAIAIGGASGAALAAPALQTLPLGMPKVLVSPVVSGETTPYIGTSDVVMIPPIIDFVGLNAYAERTLTTAAITLAALMGRWRPYPDASASTLAVTAFGVTSPLVEKLGKLLAAEQTKQAVFAANGIGGRSYERFVDEGKVFGAFDVTTSELADEMLGGVLSAGTPRLTTAVRRCVPQVVLPGAMDFINFGPFDTVPYHLQKRPIVRHTPAVTLVRTSPEENERLGTRMAERLRTGDGEFTIVVPLRGFSLVSEPGKPFHDPKADGALLYALRKELGDDVIITVDAPLNSAEVAETILDVSAAWRRKNMHVGKG